MTEADILRHPSGKVATLYSDLGWQFTFRPVVFVPRDWTPPRVMFSRGYRQGAFAAWVVGTCLPSMHRTLDERDRILGQQTAEDSVEINRRSDEAWLLNQAGKERLP